jgi:membrane associated rhomboid family serine protease
MNNYHSNPADEVKRFFKQRSILSTLILINIAVWALVNLSGVLFFLYNKPDPATADEWFLQFFAVPAYLPSLLAQPWTLISYMFLHVDFFHLLFNMLWLYWFGKIFLQYLNSKQLLQTYLAGGLAGAFLYIIAYNFFPVFSTQLPQSLALGASASVMAIVTATSFYVPNFTIQMLFIGRVKIIYLAIALFIIDFFSISSGNSGGHIAHIGGALWGFSYVTMLRKGWINPFKGDSSSWTNPFKFFFSSNKKAKTKYSNFGRPLTDEEYNLAKLANRKKMDEILEKISKGGYESLTKAEKDFLFKSSGKD